METDSNSSASSRPANRWIVRTVITIAALGGFALVLVLSVSIAGAVAGVEFSPDTFDSRAFVYYELPLVRMRITPVFRDNVSSVLQRNLALDSKLVPKSTVKPPRWHLVTMIKGRSVFPDDAQIVYRYLDEAQGGGEFWQKWTDKHPELAKVLWPAVAEVCRRDLYTFTPELFDIADQMTVPEGEAPSTDEFKAAITGSLADQYFTAGQLRVRLEDYGKAIEFYDWALKHDSENPDVLRARADARLATGDTANAKADRDRIREIESNQ